MKISILGLIVFYFFLIPKIGVGQDSCDQMLDPDWSFNQAACAPKTIQFFTDSTNVLSYEWYFGDSSTSKDRNPIYTYPNFTIYNVKLTINYRNGCRKTVEKKVAITVDDASLILNRDTAICLGQSVIISTYGNGLDSCWDPDPTLIKNAYGYTATPTQNTTYIFKSKTISKNLVPNGDFNIWDPVTPSPIGFKSDYFYSPPSGLAEGWYTIEKNPKNWHWLFSPCADHTTKSGNMMIVNGSYIANERVWYTTVDVVKNTNYVFSTWLQSVNTYGGNLALLQFSINGQVIGVPFSGNSQTCVWNQFFATWNSGENTKATISIVNLNTIWDGNDFALDDIFFGEIFFKTDSLKVTVNKPVSIEKTASICQGDKYTLPSGRTVSAGGPYVEIFKTSTGCDSTVTTTLTVNPVKKQTVNPTICAGQNFTLPSGKVVSSPGLYSDTLKSSTGCDSIITTNLNVEAVKTKLVKAFICAGQSYTLPSGTIVNSSGRYVETIAAASGCDSTITTDLTIEQVKARTVSASICAGQSYILPSGKKVNASGTYVEIFKSSGGCDSTITTEVSIEPVKTGFVTASICAGQSYRLPSGKTANTAGTYVETIKSLGGCDSVITINLAVEAVKTQYVYAFICAGTSYTLPSGRTVNAAGLYVETLNAVSGCDSTVTTNLSVGPTKTTYVSASICAGQTYTLPSGATVNASGTYVETLRAASGCDSTITTKLTVESAKTKSINPVICAGQGYILPSGKTVSVSGMYVETIKSLSGCDSTISINLTVEPINAVAISASICAGQNYTLPSGKSVTASGRYIETFRSVTGCDSIITTDLVVEPVKNETLIASICSGQSYTLPSGKTVSTAGTYTESIKSISGCDSIITVKLSIGNVTIINKFATVCAGETYTLPSGKTVNVSGIYTETIKSPTTCDSIITINLTIQEPKKSTVNASVCAGYVYTLPSGRTVNSTGTYTETIKAVSGCDSIVTTNLFVMDLKTETITASICPGQSYTLPTGKTVNSAGTYRETIKTSTGCDSIITVNLSIGSAVTINKSVSICAGENYILPSGKIVNTTGSYSETIKSSTTCDSVITVNLTVVQVKKQALAASICAGQSYTLASGKIVNSSGTYIETIKSVGGCDSIITTDLVVLEPKKETVTAVVCAGQSFTLPSGKVVKTTGVYTEIFKSASGCDSTIIINLTVEGSKTKNIEASICSNQSYTLPSGKTVNNSGIYVETIKTTSGCDSTITVNLSVGSAINVNRNATICSGETYILPSGKVVNASGTYTETVKSATTCDSVITTVITVEEPQRATINATTCFGQSYTLPSGKTVNTAGTYTETIRTVSGCDSIVTVNLTIGSVITLNRAATICAGQSYILPSGKTVTTSGTYTETIRSATTCDSVITTNLTVTEVKRETATATICSGQAYRLPSGKVVSTSGSYTDVFKSVSGCDSLITTVNLTVGNSFTVNKSASLCTGQSYTLPSGKIVTTPGTYTETFKTVTGCDSIITITLTTQTSKKQNIIATICAGRSFVMPSGNTVSAAGIYTETLKSIGGCDSIITTLNLSVGTVAKVSRAAAICDGEKYRLPWGGLASRAGTYSDTLRNTSGCDSVISSVNLVVKRKPQITLQKSNDINCIYGVATLSASGGMRYSWSPIASVTSSHAASTVVSPSSTTRYKVQVTSKDGCISEDSIDVYVNKGDADGGYLMPSAFSPNGDGKNDCFGVRSWGITADLNFSVYNRFGVLLFQTKDAAECWDGDYKGVKQNPGTYVYQVFGTTACGPIYRKGTIVLIR